MQQSLKQSLLSPNKSLKIEALTLENMQLQKQINELENKISTIKLSSGWGGHLQKLDKILEILAVPQSQIIGEIGMLGKQREWLQGLEGFLGKWMQGDGQGKVGGFWGLKQKLGSLEEILNTAISQQHPQSHITKMSQWLQKTKQSLNKKLCDLVLVFPDVVRIKAGQLQAVADLLDDHVVCAYVKDLLHYVIQYDVPKAVYVVRVLGQVQEIGVGGERVLTVSRTTVMFSCQQAQKHYPSLLHSITRTLTLLQTHLLPLLPADFPPKIPATLAIHLSSLKSQIEYILPYLSLAHRKQLVLCLSPQSVEDATLYDVLVQMRLKGQDGDMMEGHLSRLVAKIKQNQGVMEDVMEFLSMCENQGRVLNVGFYICEQLILRLEDHVDFSIIEGLLQIRQNIRFKIHHPS